MLVLNAICPIRSATIPSPSIFLVYLPQSEIIIIVYVDVFASAITTILKVSNSDVTIIEYFNAFTVFLTICIDFSVVFFIPCYGFE